MSTVPFTYLLLKSLNKNEEAAEVEENTVVYQKLNNQVSTLLIEFTANPLQSQSKLENFINNLNKHEYSDFLLSVNQWFISNRPQENLYS